MWEGGKSNKKRERLDMSTPRERWRYQRERRKDLSTLRQTQVKSRKVGNTSERFTMRDMDRDRETQETETLIRDVL